MEELMPGSDPNSTPRSMPSRMSAKLPRDKVVARPSANKLMSMIFSPFSVDVVTQRFERFHTSWQRNTEQIAEQKRKADRNDPR